MKKNTVVGSPTRLSELSFDDLNDEIVGDWRLKAERLQARRWRKLKQQLI